MRPFWRLLVAVLLAGLTMPLLAQQGFVTATPVPAASPTPPAAFVTITPQPLPPTLIAGLLAAPAPETSVAFYALSGWFQQDMVTLFDRQLDGLPQGGADELLAAQLTEFELLTRFPNAPTDDQLGVMVAKLLAAPVGVIDFRPLVRRYVLQALNAQSAVANPMIPGFSVGVYTAKFNTDAYPDAVVRVVYPQQPTQDNPTRYDDTLLTTRDADGRYTLIQDETRVPAFPFVDVSSVAFDRIADVNRDGLDEVIFVINDAQVSDRLAIVAVQDGRAVELTRPGDEIRVGRLLEWAFDTDTRDAAPIQVLEITARPNPYGWSCTATLPVTWRYENNLYRRSVALNTSPAADESLACVLLAAEPLFGATPTAAIATLERAVGNYPTDAPDYTRALLTLALMYALDGRLDNAVRTTEIVRSTATPESPLSSQANALQIALGDPQNTILDWCVALVTAAPDPICDLNGLLDRFLGSVPLTTASDLRTQLQEYGFPVADVTTSTEVGKATRTIVQFALPTTAPVAFLAQRDGTYAHERLPMPTAVGDDDTAIDRPRAAVRALLQNNDPVAAIALIDSYERNLSGQALSDASRYIRALCYDLTGQRERARQEYYALWQEAGTAIWGQLAGAHLERRQ